MDIKVSCTAQDKGPAAKTAPQIARGIFLSADEVCRAARRMLRKAGVLEADLSIVFLEGGAMRRLNRKALGHDYVTDVITFDFSREQGAGGREKKGRNAHRNGSVFPCAIRWIDGEIYVCPAEARRNARQYGEPEAREILRYVAHGILHLLGQDDATLVQRARMGKLEDQLLESAGA